MEFWNKKIEHFRIEDSQIYDAKILSPDYSQENNLSYSKIKKLRNEWIKVLPKLENLEYLFVGHRVNQEYFESICNIPNLKGLEVKVSQIKDFSSIGKLKKLENLDFCGSKGISNLKGIELLPELRYCKLSQFFGIETVEELSKLHSLEKLNLFGNYHGQSLNLKNIEPLSKLENLKVLGLDIKTKLNLNSLLNLKNLNCLILPDSYHSKMKDKLSKKIELR
ncbi:hypothetical protein LPB136_08615 [Tenacibaculum todarodis]|uniref:Leucine-rich repeat domain-containing protein n=1 Tax=Tenacibaculum todarodis TaxID=1850252 RepID=A0A1L3JJZ5_9FLAO|nr:hypothetical protein [Tenacibaculum todarodis]APG65412.1 hypothetical protein LPB136_08615 [Tenacibaculum todarodis]